MSASPTTAWLTRILIGVSVLACDIRVAAPTPRVQPDQLSKPDVVSARTVAFRSAQEVNAEKWPVRISKLRIEDASPGEQKPSAVLKFHVLNRGTTQITDIVFAISIVRKPKRGQLEDRPRLLAAPFTIRGNIVLEPGYSADYEMLLRDLSPNCGCTATVAVVSVRSVPGTQR